MVKKVYYQLYDHGYWPHERGGTTHFGLDLIRFALSPTQWEEFVEVESADTVFIYTTESLKDKLKIDFKTEREKQAYERAYDAYYDKRLDDMPQLNISLKDYEELEVKWTVIEKEWPKYLIFSLDDSGPLDKVDIEWKNELTEKDELDMQRERECHARWKKAWKLYQYDHPQVDNYWAGPADSFYQTDLDRYYDRDEPFSCKLTFTPEQIGKQLKVFVQQQVYQELIGHWFDRLSAYEVVDETKYLTYLLFRLNRMQRYQDDKISYERLEEIADMLIEGKDISGIREIQGYRD